MRVVLFGGDGFCGWPTALHLSGLGHQVIIVDNLARRRVDEELGITSLTPIDTIENRLVAWREVSRQHIEYRCFDVAAEYDRIVDLFNEFQPDSAVHFAEQRAAPYSMKSSWHKRYTVNNNVMTTHNIVCAIVESGIDIHLVHLGTMGVYGYGTGNVIPEGYLRVEMDGADGRRVKKEILHPADPGSVYHMTKTLDQLVFYYYNKNDGIRITDLHQGIVWGTNTEDTKKNFRLINRFDYDGDYGTVLNRFLMQAAIGHPLTVHGTGGQKRAFIHIQDTVRCIGLALEKPPETGERVQIYNQAVEVHRVCDLAAMVSRMTGVPVQHLPNPRNEATANELIVESQGLHRLGLNPTFLEAGLMLEVVEVARRYADRCDRSRIQATAQWRSRAYEDAIRRAKRISVGLRQ